MILAELTKLRRSALWAVAIVLPVLAVTAGSINYAANQGVLSAGWGSYWSQVVLFYGLFFMSMGVAVLASAAWRMEHRGHNRNLLMSTPARTAAIVGAKIVSLVLVVAVMQAMLLTLVVVVGVFVLDLEGAPPWEYVVVALLGVVAALPVVAVQSLLSMLIRSFTAPVAVGLLGCAIGTGLLYSGQGGVVSHLFPHSLVTSALFLGNGAVADSAGLDLAAVGPIVFAAVVLTTALWALSARLLSQRDLS
ncbi:ABC transporter permease [Nocardiopsis alkaliphila]|uniref:ABC transporter permease n=1 Tax=Nocardiopsis alkaliphila TaxID=225762 RepID=UPI00034C9474|nr:ABC transporter permease [Nocardiopsis alkaliphila]